MWIIGGLIIFATTVVVASATICAPKLPSIGEKSSNKDTIATDNSASKDNGKAEQGSRHLISDPYVLFRLLREENPKIAASHDAPNPYAIICETRSTELGLVFFTYCLVIVGWFTIRSGERTTRRMERAYIFAGPYRPIWSGQTTFTKIELGNYGRSPATIKEAYGEYSLTERSDTDAAFPLGSDHSSDIDRSGRHRLGGKPGTAGRQCHRFYGS
jgi:hypothetical protein